MRDGVGAGERGSLEVVAVHPRQGIAFVGSDGQSDHVALGIEGFLRGDRQSAAGGGFDVDD